MLWATLLLVLAASPPSASAGPSAVGADAADAAPGLEGMQVEIFDRLGDRTLLGAHPPVPADCSPESLPQDLYERGRDGRLTLLARGVLTAAYAPDGAVLFVQGEQLLELGEGEPRLVTAPVLADFAIEPLGRHLAVVRPDAEPGSWIELVDRDGRHLAVLSEPEGPDHWPLFAPDGSAVYFVSGRTGVWSWFAVDLDGGAPRQITNRGLAPGPDTLGPAFVPPPAARDSIRLLDAVTVEYDGGEGLWRVELRSGRVLAAPEGRR